MKKEVEFEGVKYIVKKPDSSVNKQAQMFSSVAFSEALDKGVKTQSYIDAASSNDAGKKQQEQMKNKLSSILSKLKRGGYSKMEARQDAIEAYHLRLELLTLMGSAKNSYTAEAMAENAYSNYIMHKCVFTEEGKPVYSSPEDYENKSDTPLAEFLSSQMSFGDSVLDTLDEVKFLKKYGFMNDDYDLVNSEGQIVDKDYNVVEDENFTEFTE